MVRRTRLFTARSLTIAAICVVAVVTVVALSFKLVDRSNEQTPSLPNVLGVTGLPWQLKLFSGAVDSSGKPLLEGDRATERLQDDYTSVESRYQSNRDMSRLETHWRPADQHQSEIQSFYQVKDEGWRTHVDTVYGDNNQIQRQDVRRDDGTLSQQTRATKAGGKSILDFAEDGITIIGETVYDPAPPCCGEGPVLKSERHWLADADHTLVYADVTDDAGRRTKTRFDGVDHQILWEMKCPQRQCEANGLAVTAYYPVTHVRRFESLSTWYVDDVKYYLTDGRLAFDMKISTSTNDVTYFDADGIKPVLEKNFYRQDSLNADRSIKMTANTVYKPYQITRFDAAGNPSVVFFFSDKSKLVNIDLNNATIDGVFYKLATYYFDGETGDFRWGALFTGDTETRREVHKEDYVLPVLPQPSADELKLKVFLTGDDVPLPLPHQDWPH